MPNDKKPIDEQLVALHFHSQVDYEDRLVAALRRAKVPTADIEEIISTESERRSANGKVMRIWTQPDAVSFDLVIKGLLGGQTRVQPPRRDTSNRPISFPPALLCRVEVRAQQRANSSGQGSRSDSR